MIRTAYVLRRGAVSQTRDYIIRRGVSHQSLLVIGAMDKSISHGCATSLSGEQGSPELDCECHYFFTNDSR